MRSRVALLLGLGVLTLPALSQDTFSAPTKPGQSARTPQLSARASQPSARSPQTSARARQPAAAPPAQPAAVPVAFRTAAHARPAPRRARTVRRRVFGVARVGRTLALRTRPRGQVSGTLTPATEFGSARVVSVAARRGRWLGVVTTALPNNQIGWVRRDDPALRAARVGYSLHADLSERSLELRRGDRAVTRMSVAVGKPGSPTPTGRFAVTDKLSGTSYGPYYGCCILALSGHQPNTPPGWTGGDRIAIHGTDAPATLGQAASAGCLRAADADLRVLMERVPLGTPVFIHG